MISQKEMAEQIGIKRSSVAVHIANLMKKGLIMGKGYVLNESDYVVVIGGAGIDINGFPKVDLVAATSNPGHVKLTLGGVGRNIGENLARLGLNVKLLSAVGQDLYGEKILTDSQNAQMDMSRVLVTSDHGTSIYLAIQDEYGDMACAISQMDAIDEVNIQYIQRVSKLLQNARSIILDTNLSQDVIEYIAETYKEIPLYLDPVSVAKAPKAKNCLGCFRTLKPNRAEIEALTGIPADTNEGLVENYKHLMAIGVNEVYVSLGDKGLFYGHEKGYGFKEAAQVDVINANGAGDSFMAGLVYSDFMGRAFEAKIQFAMAASVAALTSYETINPDMSETYVRSIIENNFKPDEIEVE